MVPGSETVHGYVFRFLFQRNVIHSCEQDTFRCNKDVSLFLIKRKRMCLLWLPDVSSSVGCDPRLPPAVIVLVHPRRRIRATTTDRGRDR